MRGFTLIEIIVVFAVLGVLSAASFVSFNSYTQSQSVQSTASSFVGTLQTAKAKAISQVKPTQCATDKLNGYRIVVATPTTYRFEVSCGSNSFILETKTLSSGVTFATGSASQVFFEVATGIVNTPGTITLTGGGKTKTVTISNTGNVVGN